VKTSIVIVARTRCLPVLNALASVYRLKESGRLEVTVVNCCGVVARQQINQAHPRLKVIDASDVLTLAQSRHLGVEHSTGDVIAILHERYTITDAWLASLESAHAEDVEVVAGPVAPPPSLTNAEWAMYLTEYAHAAPPVADRQVGLKEAMLLPGGNVSYKRRVFQMAAMSDAMWEVDYHAALYRAGARFLRLQAMCAELGSFYTMEEYLAERRWISREFAALRFHNRGVATVAIAALSRLGLAPVLASRTVRQLLKKPGLWRPLCLASPWIMRFGLVQTLAELDGILYGKCGASENRRVLD
jgi:hypothetical protein